MRLFSLTLSFGGQNSKEPYWKSVIGELEEKGANVVEIKSVPVKYGEFLRPINVVTISYQAQREVKIEYPLYKHSH